MPIDESPSAIESRANEILVADETIERIRAVVLNWKRSLANSRPPGIPWSPYETAVKHCVEEIEAVLGEGE